MKTSVLIFFAAGMHLFIPVNSKACPVPVFRYALEFWESDPYRLEIFYSNSLNRVEEELVNYLIDVCKGNKVKANLMMRKVDIESEDFDISTSVLKGRKTGDSPLMVLRYPFMSGINSILWSAPLTAENVDLLLHSPARDSIATGLLSDASAVWIFLESGDRRKDRDAMDFLENELRRLEQTLALPDFALWVGGYQGVPGEGDPKIRFDILRISRDDPREKLLVDMLMNSEKGLDEYVTEPMVFPVFGRGIILWALVGRDINENLIAETSIFMTGPCSCQAKMLNPGLDMLISRDWNALVDHIADISVVNPLTGMGDFTRREEEVKRQLESAVMERLGTSGTVGQNHGTEKKGELVYLDILDESRYMEPGGEAEADRGLPFGRTIILVLGVILSLGLVGGFLAYWLRSR